MDSNLLFRSRFGRRDFVKWSALSIPSISAAATVLGCGADSGSSNGSLSTIRELSGEDGADFIGTPIAIAKELGYFEQEGLTVNTEYPGSSPRCLQLLLAGQGDVAIPDPASVIAASGRGEDVKTIWVYGAGSFFDFGVLEDSDITTWDKETVEGARIGISEFAGGEVPLLRGALSRIGLSQDDVTFVPLGGGSPEMIDALERGDVALVAGSGPDFSSMEARGIVFRMITPEEITRFPRNSVAVMADDLEKHAESLTGYLRAINKGMLFMTANYDAAASIAKRSAPENLGDLDNETLAEVLLKGLLGSGLTAYLDPDSDVYHKLGYQDVESWNNYMTFLVEGGVETEPGVKVDKEVDVESIVDNSLIDAANDFDYEEIEQQAREYSA